MLYKCPYLMPYLEYSALWFISDNEEAHFILLFWKVDPSCDHNTLLKCVLYIWKAVYNRDLICFVSLTLKEVEP